MLQGDHDEAAVLEVTGSGCPGLAAAIPSVTQGAMAFVHHAQATAFLRARVAELMAKVSSAHDGTLARHDFMGV